MKQSPVENDQAVLRLEPASTAMGAAAPFLPLDDLRWALSDHDPGLLEKLADCEASLKERRELTAVLKRRLGEHTADTATSIAVGADPDPESSGTVNPVRQRLRPISPRKECELVQARLAEEIREIEAAHAHLVSQLSPLARAAHNVLVTWGRIPAVAIAAGGKCPECHRTIPALSQSEPQGSGGMLICVGCQRLLYHAPSGLRTPTP